MDAYSAEPVNFLSRQALQRLSQLHRLGGNLVGGIATAEPHHQLGRDRTGMTPGPSYRTRTGISVNPRNRARRARFAVPHRA